MVTPTTMIASRAAPERTAAAASARAQLTLMAAQLAAGVGNLGVSLIAARLLAPGDYADVVSFLALYLVAHVPASALTAAGAADPTRTARARGRALAAAAIAAVAVTVGAAPIAAATDLPVTMVLALAVAMPGAVLLGIARGEAYARHDVAALTRSLLAEPLTRLGLGLVLMYAVGGTGAALAAVAGGYVALVICSRGPTPTSVHGQDARTARSNDRTVRSTARDRHLAVGVGISFVTLAVFQVVDVVIANARLTELEAGRFGALSTIGGAAVFATATVPLVLLPASANGDEHARRFALRIAIVTGVVIAAVGWLAADPILRLTMGGELAGASSWLGPYLLAMGAIGVVRVLVATRWTHGDGSYAMRSVAVALAFQVVALLSLGTSVGAVVLCTLATSIGLTVALTLPPTVRPLVMPSHPRVSIGERRLADVSRSTWTMIGLVGVAFVLRAASTRGLWVDEAISVRQAQQPFSQLLRDVRDSDVHPPLHHALLWVTTRVAGSSEFAVRLPSMLAGVALVPAAAWTGRILYDRRTGWIAAALVAVAPFCVWYSQEARMYSLFMLFATIAVGAQVRAVRRGSRADWLIYSAATTAMIWTQYFAILPVLVQQLAFAAVWFRRRRDRVAVRSLLRGWLSSAALVAVATLPLLPILFDQLAAYSTRDSGLVPGQAGAASSDLDGVSVYAVAANLVWGIWGYHSDATMLLLTALWPVVMLLVLLLLGRGRSDRTVLLLALVVVPMTALFVIGSTKRDLFELRYFSGAVPVLLLLVARLVTITTRSTRAAAVAASAAVASLAIGLVDQQLNGANPRIYDFEGAIENVERIDASDDAVLLYEPAYLGDVIRYYAPDLDIRPLGASVPDDASTVWVLASERVLDARATSARVGAVLADLEQERTMLDEFHHPNVRVWQLR